MLSPRGGYVFKEEKQVKNQHIDIIQGDGRNLSLFKDNSFDVILCLGPLYHLPSDSDKRQCIEECVRVIKPNGVIAFSYINNFAALVEKMRNHPSILTKENVFNALDNFTLDGPFCFLNPEKIEQLLTDYPLNIKHHIATDGLSYSLKDKINTLSDDAFNVWFYYHLKTCEEKSLLGYSMHGLVITQKIL